VPVVPSAILPDVARPWKADPAGADVTRTFTVKLSLPPVVYGAAIVTGVVFATPT